MAARLVYHAVIGDFDKQIQAMQKPMAHAATAAVKEAASIVKTESRALLSSSGFSGRGANAMRSKLTPKTGDSINVSAEFFLKPAYLSIFEEGGVIAGKPLLWLPLDTVPLGSSGKRLTAREYVERIGPLHSVRGGKRPMLVGKGTRSTILRATAKVVRFRKGALGRGQSQGSENIPLFIGVPAVSIRKKFDLKGLVGRVRDRLGELYLKNLKTT